MVTGPVSRYPASMKVDLHVHTSERSMCAWSPALAQMAAAVRAGLGAVAITDHHALVPDDERAMLQERFPGLLILPGIEITLDDAYEDILVIGLAAPELARGSWSWPDLRAFASEGGGLTILAHPLRYADHVAIDLERHPPDAVEVSSTNIKPAHQHAIRELAERHGLPLVASSDAHRAGDVGRHATRLDEPATTAGEVIAAIRAGRYSLA
jgi:predicted metal-dependent phosphoesterase TrpH